MANPESIEELRRRKAAALALGGEEKLAARRVAGRWNVRERIEHLLDAGSFREVGILNHSDVPGMEEKTPADGKVCGTGRIDGRTVVVLADDHTVLAGSGGRVGGRKYQKLSALAKEKGYPIVNLGEGGGARVPDIMGSDGLSTMTIGRAAGLRQRAVPMVATIMGECFGAPSWFAALADFVVQVKGSCMAVSGPRVLEMATGEKTSNEELGGWQVHAEITGQIDAVAEDEAQCFEIVRAFLSYLPSHKDALPPAIAGDPEAEARQEKLLTILPEKNNRTYDMHDILRTIVDHERLFEVKADFDRSVITCLARLDGHTVGFIANNPKHLAGASGPDGCAKCCAFIALCDSFHIPLVFLHDTPGFFVGKAAEHKGMPGKIINFIEALCLSTVPKISIIIRRTYGMAFGNMCGGNMGADFEYAWPTADMSFTAPEVAANIMYAKKIQQTEDPEAARKAAVAEMQAISTPWRAAGLGLLDDVIEPTETRRVLIESLALARGKSGGKSERLLAAWPTTFS
ncbi:MAG: carboxyl transferase [Candidatus Hydrogenedentes bacterium]|nr:carboxyl transferase [Candidatus Hydrogenedentota bacterium]